MSPKRIPKKLWLPLLCLVLLLGIGAGSLARYVFSADARFSRYTQDFFQREIAGSTLNLHYTLAHPEDCGVTPPAVSLGQVHSQTGEEAGQALDSLIQEISAFPSKDLSRRHQITRDMLLLYFKTQRSLGDLYLLEEALSPSLGIQAQLPVLLAEYTFYDEQDILDYLTLLTCLEDYFRGILAFEEKKSNAGLFMSDASLDGVLAQCRAFLAQREDSYLEELYQEKLEAFDFPAAKKEKFLRVHQRLLQEEVFPAYESLMAGLEPLRGTGKNPNGLAHLPGGREYYQYLLRSQSGVYTSVEEAWKRLHAQLMEDSSQMARLLEDSPRLLEAYGEDIGEFSPQEALSLLEKRSRKDFPPLEQTDYRVKYVHESLEDFSSPAFYLTPPIDTNSPNTIYLNRKSETGNLERFTTLAHEGFPGHLYQTLAFSQTNQENIRHLLGFSGYVEGWATYIESFAYQYAGLEEDLGRLLWLNRSVNLCLYSLLDIGIHYYGWDVSNAAEFLSAFGIVSPSVTAEIFQYIVETPGNYLKYYLGCLNFLDLREMVKEKEGSAFDLVDFHRRVLEIGPVQFPVLKKYLLQEPQA